MSVVVVVHEFGHYLLARLCDVRILEFAAGFGKKIFSFEDRYGTHWQIRALPLGGYVKMHGDQDPASINVSDQPLVSKDDEHAFCNKSLGQRFAIVIAGPLFNYALGILLYAGVAFVHGVTFVPNIIGAVEENAPAYKAGLKAGDVVLEINGRRVESFGQIGRELILGSGDSVKMLALRDGKIVVANVVPDLRVVGKGGKKSKFIGISGVQPKIVKKSLLGSLSYGAGEAYDVSTSSLRAIKQMFARNLSPRELGGPIKIATYSAAASSAGIYSLIIFSAFISINLGLMNLLPVPILDGGHLMFYAFEAMIGRPIPPLAYKIASYAGMFIIGALMLFTIVNDLLGLA